MTMGGRWADDKEMFCAAEPRSRLNKNQHPASLEPGTAGSTGPALYLLGYRYCATPAPESDQLSGKDLFILFTIHVLRES